MRPHLQYAVALAAALACSSNKSAESDEAKLIRLKDNAFRTSIIAGHYKEIADSLVRLAPPTAPSTPTALAYFDSLEHAEAQAQLAQRELSLFMNGK